MQVRPNLRVLIICVVFSRPGECSRRSHSVAGRRVGRSNCRQPGEPGVSVHHPGAGVAAGHPVKRRIGKGQWRFIAGDGDRAQRMQPPSGRQRVGWPCFR